MNTELTTTLFQKQTEKQSLSADGNSEIVIPYSMLQENTIIDVLPEQMKAKVGDSGYFVIPDSFHLSSQLTYFRARDEGEQLFVNPLMSMFGIVKGEKAVLAIVTGMSLAFHLVLGLFRAKYTLTARFDLTDCTPDEDIRIRLIPLSGDDANYSGMARAYRQYQLNRGFVKPIRERLQNSPVLEYAQNAFSIRIRHGWKPRPTNVFHQTPENEPKMYTAIDFERTIKLMDCLKAHGVDKAEFCLVGWNKSGHDGRFPQHFPVEADLGGEEGMMKVLKHAQELGYLVDLFTNSTGAYEVADSFSPDITAKDKEGNMQVGGVTGSGYCYRMCPKVAYEKNDVNLLPKLGQDGFRGLHYIDVQTIVPPRECFDINHPLTKRQWVEYIHNIMRLSKESFGGYSSEGAYDCYADDLDYALYVCFDLTTPRQFYDERVPLWQLVYHGIVMCNPSAETINYPVKGWWERLLSVEYGSRPAMYYYSKFCASGLNWMGETDLMCDTDKMMEDSAVKVAKAYQDYQTIAHLQTEFMEKHEILSKSLRRVTYSDGTQILLNFGEDGIELDGRQIPAHDYIVLKGEAYEPGC